MSYGKERVAKVAERIAADDDALAMVDQAVDTIIASIMVIDEQLPKVKPDNVPEQAAVDTVKELMNEAIKPYMADIVKAIEVFGGE